MADWEKEYRTMNPNYEAEILRTFAKFVEKGLVYRSKKPVYWSIPCRTALAEAEIEYQDHLSPSIFVRFRMIGVERESYLIIWTTTPWTLPANLAVSVHPKEKYQELRIGDLSYWVGSSLAESVIEACEMKEVVRGNEVLGEELVGSATQHPFIDRKSPVLSADYVTMDAGTGCVHIARTRLGRLSHWHLPIIWIFIVPWMITGVIRMMVKFPMIWSVFQYWRKPMVVPLIRRCFQSSLQTGTYWQSMIIIINTLIVGEVRLQLYSGPWISGLSLWTKMDCVIGAWRQSQVFLSPPIGGKIGLEVFSNPDQIGAFQATWQRGVPIPVFYDQDGEPLLDHDLILFLDKIEQQGTDYWFSTSEEELLSGFELPAEWKDKEILKKGTDTLRACGSILGAVIDRF